MFGDMSKYMYPMRSDGRNIMMGRDERESYIQTQVICERLDTHIVRQFAIRRRVAEGNAR